MELCFCKKSSPGTPASSFRRFNNRCSTSPSAKKSHVSTQSESDRVENGPLRNNFVLKTDNGIPNGGVKVLSSTF